MPCLRALRFAIAEKLDPAAVDQKVERHGDRGSLPPRSFTCGTASRTQPRPGSLSANEVYAVSVFILARTDIISDEQGATLDAQSSADVTMTNAEDFVPHPRPDVEATE